MDALDTMLLRYVLPKQKESVPLQSSESPKKELPHTKVSAYRNIHPSFPEPKQERKVHITYALEIPVPELPYEKLLFSYVGKTQQLTVEAKQEGKHADATVQLQDEEEEYRLRLLYSPKHNVFHLHYEAREYQKDLERSRVDFTNRVDKFLEIIPKNLMGGVLGFTYLGSGKMARRDDLFGAMAELVDVHEAIHTPDEYETRVLTTWMLDRTPKKYVP